MAYTKACRNFWLAYANAIKEALDFEPSGDTAIYIASKTQKGPFVSPRVPADYTNSGIFEACNNYLHPNSLFYDPTSKDSYIESLKDYLMLVDIGAEDQVAVQIESYIKDLDHNLEIYGRLKEKALKTFRKHSDTGDTGDLTFLQWYHTNALAFCNSSRDVDAALAALITSANNVGSTLAQRWAKDLRKLVFALKCEQQISGITMDSNSASAEQRQRMLIAVRSGRRLAAPKSSVCVPAYYCPLYQDVVPNWTDARSSDKPSDRMYIRYAEGEIAAEGDFGQTADQGEFDFTYTPWVSFNTAESEILLESDIADDSVDITITFNDIRALAVSPGTWDVENPESAYRRMKHASKVPTQLVQPQAIIVIQNLSFRIGFRGVLVSEVSEKIDLIRTSGGFLRILGVPVKIGGDSSTDDTSHVGTWDNNNGVLEVLPTADGAFATVVAMIGKPLYMN